MYFFFQFEIMRKAMLLQKYIKINNLTGKDVRHNIRMYIICPPTYAYYDLVKKRYIIIYNQKTFFNLDSDVTILYVKLKTKHCRY